MVKEFHVEGYDAFKSKVDEHKGQNVFALFSGSVDNAGRSWCPDCVTADPVIAKHVPKAPADAVYIHCGVGDRAFWKDQKNAFRTDPQLLLKGVPTLLNIGKPKRLQEEQCAKDDLVEMFFTEDD